MGHIPAVLCCAVVIVCTGSRITEINNNKSKNEMFKAHLNRDKRINLHFNIPKMKNVYFE